MNGEISDLQLNALADGELPSAQAEVLLERVQGDATLRARLGETLVVKRMLRLAYAEATPTKRLADPGRGPFGWRMAAACAVLALGLGGGWAAREVFPRATELTAGRPGASAMLAQADAGRIIIVLSDSAPARGLAVLDRAEGLLEAAQGSGQPIQVEIVANAGGLDLLRADVSPYAARIGRLQAAYPSLSLVACGLTAQRLREGGTVLHWLPGTIIASSAIDKVVQRLRQGWTYLRA